MRTRRPVVVAAALATYVLLTALVWVGALDGLDRAVLRWGDGHRVHALLELAQGVTDTLSPVVDAGVLLAGAALVAARRRRWRPLVIAVGVLLVTSAVVLGVKYAVNRPLPHSHGHGDQGFPSGHTAATAVFLGALALLAAGADLRLRRRLLLTVAVLTLLIAAALVYAGFHWLTDTVASIALAVAILGSSAMDRLGRTLNDP
jgi:MYXO-CTERM domain-containing protein